MAGVRRGAFTCVGWQVTLCDPIWQVTLRSSEMGFPGRAISSFLPVSSVQSEVLVTLCTFIINTDFQEVNGFASMTSNPPPYGEKAGMYPSVPPDPYQHPQQPGGYYPPHQQPAPAGSPGYYPPPQQQPQQFTVASPTTVVVAPQQPVQSFVAHIVLSCFVFWCCGCLCGLIAFIFASKLNNIIMKIIIHHRW